MSIKKWNELEIAIAEHPKQQINCSKMNLKGIIESKIENFTHPQAIQLVGNFHPLLTSDNIVDVEEFVHYGHIQFS